MYRPRVVRTAIREPPTRRRGVSRVHARSPGDVYSVGFGHDGSCLFGPALGRPTRSFRQKGLHEFLEVPDVGWLAQLVRGSDRADKPRSQTRPRVDRPLSGTDEPDRVWLDAQAEEDSQRDRSALNCQMLTRVRDAGQGGRYALWTPDQRGGSPTNRSRS